MSRNGGAEMPHCSDERMRPILKRSRRPAAIRSTLIRRRCAMSMSVTLQECLRQKASRYEVIHHPYSHSNMEAAAAAHVPGDRLAKTVLLEDAQGYVAAVLPTTHAVRLSELWAKTGRHLVLAKEVELRELFKDCDVGALPPVCMAYGMQTFLDDSLARQPDVYFEAGDHEELVHMDRDEFLALMDKAERASFSHKIQGVVS